MFIEMKKVLSVLLVMMYLGLSFVPFISLAVDDPFVLIPKAKDEHYGDAVKELWNVTEAGKFWGKYDTKAKEMKKDLGAQMGSGIMNRDTILSLLGRVVIFIANTALVVGAAMVIYAGYLYASHIFSWADASSANNAIKYAIIGIVVVIFSYTILRLVIHAFL